MEKSIVRYAGNPVLSKKDVPYEADLVFNAGVAKFGGQYVMIFRDDYGYDGKRFAGTHLGLALSPDGVRWNVRPKPFLSQESARSEEVSRIYDPRLTVLDGALFMTFAMDTRHGVRGGIARVADDLSGFEILSLTTPDNRNLALFPEKIGGLYARLERPMPVYSFGRDKFDIWISYSPDLKYWGDSRLVLAVEDVPFANDKIGPAAPPIRTPRGWLALFHAVDRDETRGKNGWEDSWKKRYSAGIMLLDPEHPEKVLGMCKTPLLWPEAPCETENGFRNDAIFPGGMVAEDDGSVKIYYGSADIVECLAVADLENLFSLCTEPK